MSESDLVIISPEVVLASPNDRYSVEAVGASPQVIDPNSSTVYANEVFLADSIGSDSMQREDTTSAGANELTFSYGPATINIDPQVNVESLQ